MKRHPPFLGEVVKRNPVTHSQQKSRSMNGRRLCATLFGPPSPRRTIAVSTGEAYPKHRRVSKAKPHAWQYASTPSLLYSQCNKCVLQLTS